MERKAGELSKMAALSSPAFVEAVRILSETDLLGQVLPEARPSSGCHTIPDTTPRAMSSLTPYRRWRPQHQSRPGHEPVGKAATLEFQEDQPTYHGHDKTGAAIIPVQNRQQCWARSNSGANGTAWMPLSASSWRSAP